MDPMSLIGKRATAPTLSGRVKGFAYIEGQTLQLLLCEPNDTSKELGWVLFDADCKIEE